jgi:hypothetical protein
MLTNEDKAAVVSQHIRNVDLNAYNLELSLIEANAKSSPDQTSIDSINAQLTDLTAQKTALQAELTSLQA